MMIIIGAPAPQRVVLYGGGSRELVTWSSFLRGASMLCRPPIARYCRTVTEVQQQQQVEQMKTCNCKVFGRLFPSICTDAATLVGVTMAGAKRVAWGGMGFVIKIIKGGVMTGLHHVRSHGGGCCNHEVSVLLCCVNTLPTCLPAYLLLTS